MVKNKKFRISVDRDELLFIIAKTGNVDTEDEAFDNKLMKLSDRLMRLT